MNAPRGGAGGGGPKPSSSTKNKTGSSSNSNNKNSNRGNRSRRNRHKQNRNKPRRSQRGPPQSPQVKLNFRNIGNTEVYGTVEGIAGIFRAIVDKANERLTGSTDKKIVLDKESLEKLIEADKLATAAREDWKKQQEGEKDNENESEQPSPTQGEAEINKHDDDANSDLVSGMEGLDIDDNKGGMIHARPLYVVPPKKTRRRGEKPGNAYLVLTTPPIQAIEVTPPPVAEAATEEGTEDANEEKVTEVPPAPPKVDYSRQVAERQLALVRAVEVMTAIALEDCKTDQQWAGCVVEECINGKSWRPPQRKDHRDGTIMESAGFKAFIEMTTKEKEELQARPKPAPGGGVTTLTTGLLASENGKPVAALVQHLQNKREQEKTQKKNKRKAKDAKKKASSGTVSSNGKADGTTKKRGGRRKNKKSAAGKKAEPKS